MDIKERYSMSVQERMEVAKLAEETFIKWQKENGTRMLQDVRDDDEYKFYDVDFVLWEPLENPIKVDVKSRDNNEEPDELRYELAVDFKLGWGTRTKADYLFYVWIDTTNGRVPKKAWIVDVLKFKKYLCKTKTKKKLYIREDKGICNFYVKVEDLKQHDVIIKEIIL